MKKGTNKKRISVVALCLMFFAMGSLQLLAQKASSELTVHAAGAFSTYVQPTIKGSSVGYNSDFGVGFTGFFSQHVGINVGVGLGFFNIKSTVTDIHRTVTSGPGFQASGYFYDLHTALSGYTETHKSMFLNVPVMFVYQTQKYQPWSWKQSKKPSFYLMTGGKALLLFHNRYDVSVTSITNRAYFPEFDNWAETQEFAGLGRFDNEGKGYSSSDKMEFGVIIAAAIELGVKWRTEGSVAIYTGAFLDWGFTIKDNRIPYGEYIYEKNLQDDLTLMKFADTYLVTAGIKLRIAFSRRQISRY